MSQSRSQRRLSVLVTIPVTALLVVVAGGTLSASPSGAAAAHKDRARLAQLLLRQRASAGLGTGAMTRALQVDAGLGGQPGRASAPVAAARAPGTAPRSARTFTNVPVNDPSLDTHQTDQTTQSEPSVTVSGGAVAVGFNDTQQALTALTAGRDLSGYAYSTDGGRSFTDGGTIPNAAGFVNSGDPWLTSDRSGAMYYATLAFGGDVGNLEVVVSRSADGGRTWATPRFASPRRSDVLYAADKDALTVGRAPSAPDRDVVYAAWSDVTCDVVTFTCQDGLAVSRSADGGRTWTLAHASRTSFDAETCSFAALTGAQPLVDPKDGTLYVAAERVAVSDPSCTGRAPVRRTQVVFRSTDGGRSFGPAVTVSKVTAATPQGVLRLAPGQLMRTSEFPTLALRAGTLYLAWNDGARGRSHLLLARSTDRGRTWTVSALTGGRRDELMPALSADAAGLHLLHYQRNADNTLDVGLLESSDGATFTARTVSSTSFPGVQTLPPFDPQTEAAYMGDYIANVSDGTHRYFAWGDNRGVVTDFMFPAGRHDPDVFFARD